MSAVARQGSYPELLVRRTRKFLRTPKGLLLVLFVPLTCLAIVTTGHNTIASVAIAVGTAAVVDVAITWGNDDTWIFPSGALLTGLLVAFVLAPQEPWYVVAITAGVAISTKRLFRTRFANIFNPAALALAISAIAFSSGQSWWGGLTNMGPAGIVVLVALGLIIADYINKLPLVLAFLVAYFLLFTGASILGSAAQVAEIFRAPDVNAALFFAFFMLDDPPTSPVRYSHQIAFGLIVAVSSWTLFLALGSVYYLLAGVLLGNVWEAWRRGRQAHARSTARTAPPALARRTWARPDAGVGSDAAS